MNVFMHSHGKYENGEIMSRRVARGVFFDFPYMYARVQYAPHYVIIS